MDEIKFIKFSSLEERIKKHIEKKFPGIKESDLIFIEHCEFNKDDIFTKFYETYVVTEIASDGMDLACSSHGEKEFYGMDERLKNVLDNAPEGFTIYSPASDEKTEAEIPEGVKPEEAADPEAGKFEEVEITRKCGHKEIVKIRKTNDKDYREHLIFEELNKRPLCRDCWEKDAKEKAKKAKESAKKEGLPALKGSAKQKKWAETIRAEKLSMLSKDPTMYEVLHWYIKNYTKASEWIDVRFMEEWQLKENMEIRLRLKR